MTGEPVTTMPAATDWRRELANAFTDIDELLVFLAVEHEHLPLPVARSKDFPLLVPRRFASQMQKGDPADPLLRQVLPISAELERIPGYSDDPLREGDARTTAGLLRKYDGRALLLATSGCAIHCRYCFRRHFPHQQLPPRAAWQQALAEIEAAPDIHEVILSGGDPLLLDDATLCDLFRRLASIKHLRRLRLHTRIPVVLPSRVNDRLCAMLAEHPRPCVVVVHANHPSELASEQLDACTALSQSGVILLNQSVLLRAVNDSVETLAELSERLFDLGILPYYLHQLDRVAGAAHFAVADREAVRLLESLRARVPGYLVPRLVRETPALPYKLPLV